MTDRKLPRNSNYTDILPKAVKSSSKRRVYYPVNGNSFSPTGNNIIRIDISGDSFLDTKNSYLSFRVVNDCGVTFGTDFGGGYSFIRRLRVEQAGNVLTDCNNYNRLMSSIILPCQGDKDNVKYRSVTEHVRYLNAKAGTHFHAAPVQAADLSGASLTTPANNDLLMVANLVAAPGVPTDGSSAIFSVPLVNGLLGVNQSKLIPLQLLSNSPITLEIELAPTLDVGVFAGVPATPYRIDDVRYVAQMVETPEALDQQLRIVQEQSGGAIMLSGVDYTHFQGTISTGATGQQNINVPARRRSIKSILWTGASANFVAGGANAQDLRFNLSYGGHFDMTDYSIKVGSVQYPAEPIRCDYGLAAGSAGVRAEHLTELEKCWGTLGSTTGVGSLCGINFASANCDVANMTTVVAPGAPDEQHKFCPFGIDMESFQRVSAGHDGVNTADRATPITLQLNIGGAAGKEAVQIDAYVAYDSLYYIDTTGSIRVNF